MEMIVHLTHWFHPHSKSNGLYKGFCRGAFLRILPTITRLSVLVFVLVKKNSRRFCRRMYLTELFGFGKITGHLCIFVGTEVRKRVKLDGDDDGSE